MTRADAIGFLTILRKEYVRIVRIWSQTLLPPVMNVALYLLIFGSFIGKRFGVLALVKLTDMKTDIMKEDATFRESH